MIGPLYAGSLLDGSPLDALYPDGLRVRVPVDAWRGPLQPGDQSVLDRCTDLTLDVGCGPGRLAVALQSRGTQCLGLDIAAEAVQLTRLAGAAVWHGSVFDDVPAQGCWSTALLVDGNIGIGGGPRTLLRRIRSLLAPDGVALIEVDPPSVRSERVHLRLVSGGAVGAPFRWARLSAPDADRAARAAGLRVTEEWEEADRWFVRLARA